jgi:hypothetical protein
VSSIVASETESFVMNQLIFVDGMKPGHGINVLAGDHLPNIAVDGPITALPMAHGQTVTSKLVRIDDVSSLHKSLGIDVSASGFYYGYSVNAKMKFANECNVNSHSTYLMVHIEVKNSFLSMDDPVLTSDALELLRTHKPERFRERFGDVFIAGMSTGGEYFALFEISGTSESEKEELSIDVEAAYQGLVVSAEIGVKIRSMTQSSHDHLEVSVFTFQMGGSDVSHDTTPEQIMAKARNFAQSVSGEFSVPYSVLPASYAALKRPDDASNPIDIEFQRAALADAFKQRTEMQSLKNDVDYILLSDARHFDEFEPFDVPALTQARNQLAAQLDQNFRTASKCSNDAQQCTFVQFDTSNIKLPNRRAGAPAPKLVPNFVGMTSRQADKTAQDNGITIEEFRATGDGPDDEHEGTSIQFLLFGNASHDEGQFGTPHTDDQVVVVWQQQAPGVLLKPGASVFVAYQLAPGVDP